MRLTRKEWLDLITSHPLSKVKLFTSMDHRWCLHEPPTLMDMLISRTHWIRRTMTRLPGLLFQCRKTLLLPSIHMLQPWSKRFETPSSESNLSSKQNKVDFRSSNVVVQDSFSWLHLAADLSISKTLPFTYSSISLSFSYEPVVKFKCITRW